MNGFTGGSREKSIVIGIFVVLVIALVLLFRQLTSGSGAAGSAEAPTNSSDTAEQEGEDVGDVLALLPHSEEELQRGAEVARDFTQAYTESRPDENEDDRLDRLTPLAADDFLGALEVQVRSSPTSGTPSGPLPQTTSAATVVGIRTIGDSSAVFLVDAETATDSQGDIENQTLSFAVTVVPEDGDWAVFAFQDASVGDGDGS
mgnify:CR=1 FL=1